MAQASALLEVRDLTVRYLPAEGSAPVVAVDRLSLEIRPAEVLGILGESGCGKSSLAAALLGLLPPGGEIAGGSVRLAGRELVGLDERELRRVRGAEVSLVFQEPGLALHPTRRVGEQVVEVIRAHRPWKKRRCRELAVELLAEVGFPNPEELYHAYPHQLSGGERQRIVIAQALACRPALVVADEPTASLDATIERQVLELLERLRERFEVAFLFISHDPLVLAEVADRILVMYAGRRAEEGPRDAVVQRPLHPYTEGLLACLPRPGTAAGRRPLPTLPGSAPMIHEVEAGCRFEPRCPYRMDRCRDRDPEETVPGPAAAHRVSCFRYSGEERLGGG